jgi:hypothetical protein
VVPAGVDEKPCLDPRRAMLFAHRTPGYPSGVSPGVRIRAQAWLLWWGLLVLLWIALVDTRRWQELAVGALVAALGATFASLERWRGRPPRAGRPGIGPRALLDPPWRLLVDVAALIRALAVRVRGGSAPIGRLRACRYQPERARRTAAGRAMTEIWGSLPANRYVVGIDEEAGTLLVHELMPSDEPLDPLART